MKVSDTVMLIASIAVVTKTTQQGRPANAPTAAARTEAGWQ